MTKQERERWLLTILAGCLVGAFSAGVRGDKATAAGMGVAAAGAAVVYLIVLFG